MLRFPLHNAALDLQGKPPEELPHGLLTIPPEVREIVNGQFAKYAPEARAVRGREALLRDRRLVLLRPGRARRLP
jgi:hypothetical protein